MNILDAIIVAILLVSAGFGFWRGAAYELISVGGWFAAFAAARWLSPALLPHLGWIESPTLRLGLAWGACFVLALVASGLLGSLLRMLLRATGLGVFDRSMGALFGVLRGLLIVLLLTLLGRSAGWSGVPLMQGSLLLPMLTKILSMLAPLLPASLVPTPATAPAGA